MSTWRAVLLVLLVAVLTVGTVNFIRLYLLEKERQELRELRGGSPWWPSSDLGTTTFGVNKLFGSHDIFLFVDSTHAWVSKAENGRDTVLLTWEREPTIEEKMLEIRLRELESAVKKKEETSLLDLKTIGITALTGMVTAMLTDLTKSLRGWFRRKLKKWLGPPVRT